MIKKDGKILIIDDNTDILFALKLLLKKHYKIVKTEKNPQKIYSILRKEKYDIILLDMNFRKDAISGLEGFFWLKEILKIDKNAIVIFITAYADTDKAVKSIKEGATDFILKPWQNEKLIATVSSSFKLRKKNKEIDSLKKQQKNLKSMLNASSTDFIGNSDLMKKVFENIEKVAKTDVSVLILRENETGKELVARAIHNNSLRKDEVFVSVDLGAITETLFESELFGYEKGAFTDAKKERAGRFEIASGGSLFLDEIGNLSLQAQAKLLTVLERRQIIRLGSNLPINIDIRLICATNMPLLEMIIEGKYREDLLYRINTVEIELPPLRERKDDIILLANHFFKIYNKKYKKKISGISNKTLNKLQNYHWRGNVRELQHSLERAIIMTDNKILKPQDFNFSNNNSNKIEEMELENYNLEIIEKNIILKILKKNGGNISTASKELGLTRTSLYRRMNKYNL